MNVVWSISSEENGFRPLPPWDNPQASKTIALNYARQASRLNKTIVHLYKNGDLYASYDPRVLEEEKVVPMAQRWPSVEELRPYIGRWVAIKDAKVIKDAGGPLVLIKWLRENSIEADTIVGIPKESSF